MNHSTLSLESQFELERLKRYLKSHPQSEAEAHRLAIAHFEDYLQLVSEYQKLQSQNQQLQAQNQQLQAQFLAS